jgi:hypothetical protein
MSSSQTTSFVAIVARLIWMLAGPAALLLMAYSLLRNENGWLSSQSIAFLVVLAVVIIARWFDPQTSEGQPTTTAHLRTFTAAAAGIGLAAWAVTNVIAIL